MPLQQMFSTPENSGLLDYYTYANGINIKIAKKLSNLCFGFYVIFNCHFSAPPKGKLEVTRGRERLGD
jgi:hypothetical protein